MHPPVPIKPSMVLLYHLSNQIYIPCSLRIHVASTLHQHSLLFHHPLSRPTSEAGVDMAYMQVVQVHYAAVRAGGYNPEEDTHACIDSSQDKNGASLMTYSSRRTRLNFAGLWPRYGEFWEEL